jgi:hypothetical protein
VTWLQSFIELTLVYAVVYLIAIPIAIGLALIEWVVDFIIMLKKRSKT